MIYTATTQMVRVSVKANYEGHLSDPDRENNIFSYHVVIENIGQASVQLLNRHWKIHDSLFDLREVNGEGVIGEKPVIEAGEFHEYESWCSLNSEVGRMWGTYEFIRVGTGGLFEVEIPEFQLIVPYKLN